MSSGSRTANEVPGRNQVVDLAHVHDVVQVAPVRDLPVAIALFPAVDVTPHDRHQLETAVRQAARQSRMHVRFAGGLVAVHFDQDVGDLVRVIVVPAVVGPHPLDEFLGRAHDVLRRVLRHHVRVECAPEQVLVHAIHGPAVPVQSFRDGLLVEELRHSPFIHLRTP
jgi:hypothetical protein